MTQQGGILLMELSTLVKMSNTYGSNPDNDWTLPQEIVDKTIEKYLQAYKMLTGKELA